MGTNFHLSCCVIPKVLNMKAIHNLRRSLYYRHRLLCNTKGTEYESNSQPISSGAHNTSCCVIPKVLNMKAIHNLLSETHSYTVLLCNTKGTEYESNSQPVQNHSRGRLCCCVIPKVLNMKAIHNEQPQ